MDYNYQVLNSFQQPDEFIDLSWQVSYNRFDRLWVDSGDG